MEGFLVIGAILGLLAIAGGPGLVVFVVRVGFLLVVAFFVYAIHDITSPVSPAQHDYYCSRHKDPVQCAGWVDPWAGFNLSDTPPPPATKRAAMPAPAKPGPIHLPLADGMPVPGPEARGWDVDDTSGPWGDELRPATARAERLLRRLHESEGVEMGQ